MRTRAGRVLAALMLIVVPLVGSNATWATGANSRAPISINLDDARRVCNFYDEFALHARYEALGVVFHGTAPKDGGGIGSEPCGHWGVEGYSPPNFLAFNVEGTYRDGGHPVDPEIISFRIPVGHVQVNAAHGFFVTSGVLWMRAFDSDWNLLDAASIRLSVTLQTVGVDAPNISYVVLHSSAWGWVLDDLEAS
jgi:hypothetical protein